MCLSIDMRWRFIANYIRRKQGKLHGCGFRNEIHYLPLCTVESVSILSYLLECLTSLIAGILTCTTQQYMVCVHSPHGYRPGISPAWLEIPPPCLVLCTGRRSSPHARMRMPGAAWEWRNGRMTVQKYRSIRE